MTFSNRILVGLGAGIAVGLFLGEYALVLKWAADGFVKLLQMTVLPYVTLSIVTSLGSLSYAEARRLGLRAGVVVLALWAIALLFAGLIPLAFPTIETAMFFSTTLVDRPPPFDFVDLYIPSNPFNSLANNVVPAVVLFSVIVGIALIGVERKQALLDVLRTATQAVSRATHFIVRLTPFGLFAIAATAAGTLGGEALGRLQVYLVTYVAVAFLLTFWVLPGLIAAVTPIRASEVFALTRNALITAFVVGDPRCAALGRLTRRSRIRTAFIPTGFPAGSSRAVADARGCPPGAVAQPRVATACHGWPPLLRSIYGRTSANPPEPIRFSPEITQ